MTQNVSACWATMLSSSQQRLMSGQQPASIAARRCPCTSAATVVALALVAAQLLSRHHDVAVAASASPAAAFLPGAIPRGRARHNRPETESPQECVSFHYCRLGHTRSARAGMRVSVGSSRGGDTSGSSLKPVAIPLMDAGKELARAGELLIDWTEAMGLYGGGISAAGAQLRNAGDNVAQAAASCRFKTGLELVIDELRTAGDCLAEGAGKLELAVQEADVDDQQKLKQTIQACVPLVRDLSASLEEAGAGIMQRRPLSSFGTRLVSSGDALGHLSSRIAQLEGEGSNESKARALSDEASRRLRAAGEKMEAAGRLLAPAVPSSERKPAGKSWLKGSG